MSPLRLLTVLLAAALAVVVAFWTMRLLTPRPAIAPADVAVESGDATDTTAAARLFGGPAVASASAAAASNVQVAGVLATGARAVAVLSIDGQPGRPYGVGAALPDGSRVARVQAGSVWLERNGARIELPAPARPSLAVLTAGRQAASNASAPGPGAVAPGATPAFAPPSFPPPVVPPPSAPGAPPLSAAPVAPPVRPASPVPSPNPAASPAIGAAPGAGMQPAPVLPADAVPPRAGGPTPPPAP